MLDVKRVVVESLDGKEVWMTPAQAEAIGELLDAQGGGCGFVKNYHVSSGFEVPEVVDMQVLTRFSTSKLYQRKLDALKEVKFQDVLPAINRDEVLQNLTLNELKDLFDTRLEFEMNSIKKSLDGDRSDSHRQGHDRCYARFGDGVKCHLFTEKNPEDGKMYPIKFNGLPVVQSINLPVLELNRKVVTKGLRKPKPNSRAPKRMSNAILEQLNSRSVGYKTLALKEDNFEKFVVSGMEMLPENVSPTVLDLLRD